jgi:hypothetical protein
MGNHTIDSGTKVGTIGGTLVSFLTSLNPADLVKTAIFSMVGAAVSFLTSLILKQLIKWLKSKDFW